MLQRRVRLSPGLRVVVIALSALGLLALGIVLAMGGLRGEAAGRTEELPAEPAEGDVPPMDREAPGDVETATFALG